MTIMRVDSLGFAIVLSLFGGAAGFAFENDVVKCINFGPGDVGVLLDESHFTFQIPPADVAKMQGSNCHDGSTPPEIQSVVENTRRCVVDNIQRIGREDMETGDWLDYLYRTNGICLGLPPSGYRPRCEIVSDGEPGLSNAEQVNLYDVCRVDYSPVEFEAFECYIDLNQCSFLGRQTCYTGTDPTPVQEQGIMECHQQAHLNCLSQVNEMASVCDSLASTGQVPTSANGAHAEFGNALKQDNNPIRIQTWRLGCQQLRIYHQNRAAAYGNYAQACSMAAAGNSNLQTVLDGLNQQPGAYCFNSCQDSYDTIYYSPPAAILDFGGSVFVSTSTQLNVFSASTNQTQQTSVTGMTTISDVFRTRTSLYVFGVNQSTREGVINRYGLDPTSGLLSPTTPIASLQSAAFNSSPTMTWDYATDFAALLNRGTGECYSFDPALTSFSPCGFTVPERSVFGTSECAFTQERDMVCSSYPFGGQVPVRQPYAFAQNVSQPYDLTPSTGSNCSVNPTWYYPPDRGAGCVEIYGTPGATYSITSHPAAGGAPTVVTTGRYGYGTGRSTADLGPNVNATGAFFMTDQAGRTSAGTDSRFLNRFPRLSFVRSSRSSINMRCGYQPGRPVTWTRSTSLAPGSFSVLQSYQSNRRGYSYASVPPTNQTGDRGFYRFETPSTEVPTPVATEDTFSCTAGVEQVFNCSSNDSGCPTGTTYELVSAPGLPPEVFQFSSDGTFKVTMLTFLSGTTFTYRPVYLKRFGVPVDVVLVEDTGALRNPQEYTGPGGIPYVNVPCLFYSGQSYPLYQFWLRPPDNCPLIHWHAGNFVYPLENPNAGIQDPDFPNCGFGIYGLVPVEFRSISKFQWDAFLFAHP